MVTPLKLALLNHPEPMYRIALKSGINETRLSRLSTGLFEPTAGEKDILSKVLNVPVIDLFPKVQYRKGGSHE